MLEGNALFVNGRFLSRLSKADENALLNSDPRLGRAMLIGYYSHGIPRTLAVRWRGRTNINGRWLPQFEPLEMFGAPDIIRGDYTIIEYLED